MGVKNNEYIIFKSDSSELLKRLQTFLIIKFKNHSLYSNFIDCVGIIGGGMNGVYSLPLLPTGYNGGYESQFLNDIFYQVEKINTKELKKGDNGYKIDWFYIAQTDWGTIYNSRDSKNKYKNYTDEQLKWEGSNTLIPSNIDEELDKIELKCYPERKLLKKWNENN